MSRNQFASTAFPSKIQKKVVILFRTIVTTHVEGWRISDLVCFSSFDIFFLALLACSLPAMSQIGGDIEGPPPPPMGLFNYSKAIEGCNRIWVLRN